MVGPVNLDEIREQAVEHGDIAFARRRLGRAAGTERIGASLYSVAPGARQMPVHQHGDEEEIFHIVAGDGLVWQDGSACAAGPGDTVVHPPRGMAHTFLAGEQGLELIAFGTGSDTGITWLPRAGVMWCGPRWVPLDAPHPFEAEAAAGPLERPAPGERPGNVIALEQAAPTKPDGAEVRALGRMAGARLSGLNHVVLPGGRFGAPSHCHALEEELFLILEGAGTLWLASEPHALRSGDVVARPPGTGVPHSLQAGDEGLTYLAFGTRVAGDSVFYPAAGKVRLRGLGVSIDVSARD
ncbi:MAG: cupin domain-containing protein [Solirubrobacteraceae bacterium]